MRWQLEWRQLLVVAAIFAAGLFWGSRGSTPDAPLEGSAAEVLDRSLYALGLRKDHHA